MDDPSPSDATMRRSNERHSDDDDGDEEDDFLAAIDDVLGPLPDPADSPPLDVPNDGKKRCHRRVANAEMAAFDDEDAPPAYSEQDELRDMSSLSISEVIARESDLRGIKRTGNEKLRSALIDANVLESLDDELASLREADTEAYREALVRCPDQVSDERRMRFVYVAFGELPAGELNTVLNFMADPNRQCSTLAEHNHTARTAAKMQKLVKGSAEALARHWQLRYDLFGPDRCFLPMSLTGAMQDEVDNLINRRVIQLLPVPDGSGRAILFSDLTRRELSRYSSKQEMMAAFYFLDVADESPDFLHSGHIYISNSFGLNKSAFNRSSREFGARINDFAPSKLRAMHAINPSKITHHCIIPICKRLFGKTLGMRIVTHRGSPDKISRELAQYRLPKECIPIEIGGELHFDMKEWVAQRRAIELERDSKLSAYESTSKLSQPLRTGLSPEIDALDFDGSPRTEPATKRTRL